MCAPWDASCVATKVAEKVSSTVLGQLADAVVTAERQMIDMAATWWVAVPSISLYPDSHNTDPGAAPISAVQQLHALILPITAVVAVGGMLWNGLLMVLSRKPAPLVNVLRGLWNTALWSAVGVFGTNLLLSGTDAMSTYIVLAALKSVGNASLNDRMGQVLVPAMASMPPGLVLLLGGVGLVASFIQVILMLFRDGSVLILAGVAPLAAAGSFTNATGGWLRKVLAWQLALIFYKPFAAMSYAAAIWLTEEKTSKDPRVLLVGMALMLVSLIALPVLLRFFNWTVGSLQSGGGGLGMLATAGAAGLHAGASLRGVGGGSSVNEHARYLNEVFDRGSPGGGSPGGRRGAAPTGGGNPRPGQIPGGPGSPSRPPTFIGPAPSASATAGSAVTGPAAPIVATGVAVLGAGVQMAKTVSDAAASAASDSAKGG